MNKTEMVTLLEGRLGSKGAAVAALDAVLDEITHAVASGERVTLTGFGTFERVERPARIGRNPRTGTAIEIPAAAAPRFHAGSSLRAAVSGPAPAARPRAAASSGTTTRTATPKAPAKAPAKAPVKVKDKVAAAKSAPATTSAKSAKGSKSAKKSGSTKSAKASSGKKKKK
ncbi:HU family DNA-binding protein [Pengzhenrongella phosphoraccumulans]|uniref:HU family DNA-binding protein n=1 Tax=Pengzhenrongella phosphoraccumulans TaxID=3114394 RepID=UPI00388F0C9A